MEGREGGGLRLAGEVSGEAGEKIRRRVGAAQAAFATFEAGDLTRARARLETLGRRLYSSDVRAALVACYWRMGRGLWRRGRVVETVRDEKLEMRQVRRPGLVSIVQEVDAGIGGRDGGFSRAPRASGVGGAWGGGSGERRGTPTRGASSSRGAVSSGVRAISRKSRRGLEASRTSANPPARVVHRAPDPTVARATPSDSGSFVRALRVPSRSHAGWHFSVVGCPK